MIKTKWFKLLNLFLGLLLITSFLGPTVPISNDTITRAQPVLVQMAASAPDQVVSVIVQKMTGATDVEEQVFGLGGKVTQDLKIINAFSAEMTAGTVLELARSSDVRWVTTTITRHLLMVTVMVHTSQVLSAAMEVNQVVNTLASLRWSISST